MAEPAVPGAEGAPATALLQDLARMLRHLGVQSLRASVVDRASMAFQAAWSINDDGEIRDGLAERPLDSVLPGGSSAISQLDDLPAERTLARKLSPRRWVFAWSIDERNAVVTEAQFHERRDAVSDSDTALIRLLCNTSLRESAPVSPAVAAGLAAQVWPQRDRRARRPPPRFGRSIGLALAASLLSTAWLALVAVPAAREAATAQRVEIEHQRSMADAAMTQDLSSALATGDYGDVQDSLSAFASIGYFQSAIVTNAAERIVATAGPIGKLRIGDRYKPDAAAPRRSLELALGSERYGRVAIVATAPPADAELRVSRLFAVAVVAFGSTLATVGLIAARWRGDRA